MPSASAIGSVCEGILEYLVRSQDFSPGEYYGAFWSEHGYHGPLLDYHAGGSHHHRGAGSAALALWLIGKQRGDGDLRWRAQLGFDWLAARQESAGGYTEVQNNEVPADWENTGLGELSTIALGFVVHGLGNALLQGLPPKKLYLDCLERAGHWQLSIEWPPGSGIFPHHERSPHDTLNANAHAAETLALAFLSLEELTGRALHIFHQGSRRAIRHTQALQWSNGCMPYRSNGKVTINYTSLVLWCILNLLEVLPEPVRNDWVAGKSWRESAELAAGFLCSCVAPDGRLLWEENETSTARHNLWTYLITANVLSRIGGRANAAVANRLLDYAFCLRTPSGLLPMRDHGEEISECLFMQADMLLFLLPFSDLLA